MLRSMFGMGGSEILVILIVALLFLGPDKLPEAAKKISKGIRDIKKQSMALQRTIEDDEHIGGAIRDLKSALRGDDEPVRPKPIKPIKALSEPSPAEATAVTAVVAEPAAGDAPSPAPNILGEHHADAAAGDPAPAAGTDAPPPADDRKLADAAAPAHDPAPAEPPAPRLTLPPTAGEADGPAASAEHDAELAALIKPAAGTVARGPVVADEPNHG